MAGPCTFSPTQTINHPDNSPQAASAWWIGNLALPAAQAAAKLLLLKFQKDAAEDKEDEAIRIINAAITEYCECLDNLLPLLESATDDVPRPAMYAPVNVSGEVLENVKDNVKLACYTREYAEVVASNAREVDLIRAKIINPLFEEQQECTWIQIGDLLKGKLPTGDVIEVLTDAAELNAATGRFGTCTNSARALGLSQLRAQSLGRQEKRAEEAHQNQHVSPLQRIPDMEKFMLDPAQRISFALQQAQLIQNSLQNAYNLCAKKDPYLAAEWQSKLSCCQSTLQAALSKASVKTGFVPNYLGIFGPQVNDTISNLFDGFGQSSTNTQNNPLRAIPVPDSTSPIPSGIIVGQK